MPFLMPNSQVKIQLNPQKIATKGFSTDSGRFLVYFLTYWKFTKVGTPEKVFFFQDGAQDGRHFTRINNNT